MCKGFIIQCVLNLACLHLYAQKTDDFQIQKVEIKIKGSHYNTIAVIDSRPDTTSMGIVQLGAFNRKAKVVPKVVLTTQLNELFKSLVDESAASGRVVLQIRQFSFAEITGTISEKGYCYIRAEFYAEKGSRYQKINSLDTVVCLKSAIDVTAPIKQGGAEAISNFMASNLTRDGAGTISYTYNDIVNIDNFEKGSMKVYNVTTYTDGLYLTYAAFRDQIPDKKITLTDHDINSGNDINSGTIKAPDAQGKLQKVKANRIFAIVYKGQPFIATRFEYYPLKKVNNDFLFTGKGEVAASTADVMISSAFMGALGGLMAQNQESMFEMKLDHLNGGFIRLKELPDPETANRDK